MKPALAQGGQQLVQVLLGDVAAEGDFRGLQRPTAVVAGELDQRAEAVVAAGGDAQLSSRCLPRASPDKVE